MVIQMVYYLIICRSLTYAQRTEAALSKSGITATILRAPKSVDSEGCSHAVRVSERNLASALVILARVGLSPKRLFVFAGEGNYTVVLL